MKREQERHFSMNGRDQDILVHHIGKDIITSELDAARIRLEGDAELSDEEYEKQNHFSRKSVRDDIARLEALLAREPKA